MPGGVLLRHSLAASEAGAIGGAARQELAVKLSHIPAILGLIILWILLITGFLKKPGQ